MPKHHNHQDRLDQIHHLAREALYNPQGPAARKIERLTRPSQSIIGAQLPRHPVLPEQVRLGASISALACSSDGRFLAVGAGVEIILVENTTRTIWKRIVGHQNPLRALAWSPDSMVLASGDEGGAVAVWDIHKQQLLNSVLAFNDRVVAVAWVTMVGTPLLFFAAQRGEVWVWPLGKEAHRFSDDSLPLQQVSNLAFAPGGSGKLAITSLAGHTIALDVHASTGSTLSAEGMRGAFTALAWSPDGTRIASGAASGDVTVWTPFTGSTSQSIPAHTGLVSALAWSPDGRFLASVGEDGIARIWDASTLYRYAVSSSQAPLRTLVWLGANLVLGGQSGVVE